MNIPCLCIPRVFSNINKNQIYKVINELELGEIDRIDIVNKNSEKGEKYNLVFIHIKKWFINENALTAQERLTNGKEIKIIYQDPWFWKVSAYRKDTHTTYTSSYSKNKENKQNKQK
jgi:hypothetical protein